MVKFWQVGKPRYIPFKFITFCSFVLFWPLYYKREKDRYDFMSTIRKRNTLLKEQSAFLEKELNAQIKDFEGNYINLNNKEKEFTILFHGDFQIFFRLYTAFEQVLKGQDYGIIYLTDSTKIKDLIMNVMKTTLPNVTYTFEEDSDKIESIGIKKNNIYVLNGKNEIISDINIINNDEKTNIEYAKIIKVRLNKELDKKFIRKFDFEQISSK